MVSCGSTNVYSSIERAEDINVEDYGAIPNDGKDDSHAIQSAIDAALCTGKSLVNLGPGVFNLDKGLVLAKKCDDKDIQFVTVHLKGHVPVYDTDQKLGETTVLVIPQEGFALAVQKARNSRIENIVFQGRYKGAKDLKAILDMGPGLRKEVQYSPPCAIAIDPFHVKVPLARRYNGYSHWYEYNSNAGSSMLTVSNCAFLDMEVAIANNPSLGVNNGDNIRVENSHVKRCHTFWACGQTQSRLNSIVNVYALFVHTFIDGRSIGAGQGTPPVISECNLAGGIKYLFNLQSGFAGAYVYRTYMESVWSLGLSMMNVTSFDQTHVKFHIPQPKEPMPGFHIFSDRGVSFRDCSIEYFSNCTYKMPFFFRSKSLIIDGGHIEGGIPVSRGHTNRGGEYLHNTDLRGVNVKCSGQIAGRKSFSKPKANIKGDIILGGEFFLATEGDTIRNSGDTYELTFLGQGQPKSSGDHKWTVRLTKGKAKPGDGLFSEYTRNLSEWGMPQYTYRPALGFVEKVQGDLIIYIGSGTDNLKGQTTFYSLRWPQVFITEDSPYYFPKKGRSR
jgi:hypothetical protein